MLSEVRWGASPRTWRESSLNTTSHVEINFIEKFTSGRSLRPAVRCSMTWFLSWSPCWECARAIREFLHQHPNVSLVIYVARLYWHVDEQNRQGLRDLVTSGVRVQIMSDSGKAASRGRWPLCRWELVSQQWKVQADWRKEQGGLEGQEGHQPYTSFPRPPRWPLGQLHSLGARLEAWIWPVLHKCCPGAPHPHRRPS